MPTTKPAWDIATIFPDQGDWTEADYLLLPGKHLVELSDGKVEVLSMPSERHQRMVIFLLTLLRAFVSANKLGQVLVAPFRISLRPGKMREPDIMFMFTQHFHRRHEQFWEGADLVMEIVSPDDPERDTVIKRAEYAQAGIPEYWLVNPLDETISVFGLAQGERVYREHGVYKPGQVAVSQLLEGFNVDVTTVFEE
jgi:Uma2 family endonuclease